MPALRGLAARNTVELANQHWASTRSALTLFLGMRRFIAAIAIVVLAGRASAQSSSPVAPGISDRPPSTAPAGPGRKGLAGAPSGGSSPALPPVVTAPKPRNDPRARRQQDEWRRDHPGDTYHYSIDEVHRMVFASCLDDASQADMQKMLAAQIDQQAATLFEAPPDTEIFVAVATPADIKKIFADSPTSAGMYEHPRRRIVTGDIGTVLRHEYTHAMHFGHMERLGQPHVMWVQEGLASLYEVYELAPDTSIRFVPTERHNQARKIAANKRAISLAQVVTMNPDEFMAKSQSLYPVVRSVFEYMADQGKLRAWYKRYVDTFAQDRSGRRAIEDIFGETIDEFEASWRAWVLARPAVDVAVGRGDRNVGVDIKAATDGVEVTRVARGSAAQRAGIVAGDVIVAIDGTPVRSPREWTEATAAIRVPELAITIRRAGKRSEITLIFDAQANAMPRGAGEHAIVTPAEFQWAEIRGGFLYKVQFASES